MGTNGIEYSEEEGIFPKTKPLAVIEKEVGRRLKPLGFGKEWPHAFRRDTNDIRWYFGLQRHPKSPPEADVITVEACTYSAPLERMVNKFLGSKPNWYQSQIRYDLFELAKLPWGDPLSYRTWYVAPEDAERMASEIADLVMDVGLPFLEQIQSTDDIIPFLRSGRGFASKERGNYDADIWEGKIDPKVTPFVPRQSRTKKEYTSTEELIADLKADAEDWEQE